MTKAEKLSSVNIYEIEYKELGEYVKLHRKICNTKETAITSYARFWNSKFDKFREHLVQEQIKFDGYRYYFIRFTEECIQSNKYECTRYMRMDGSHTQMTIAIVPCIEVEKESKKDPAEENTMKDIVNSNGKIWVLFPGGENTGLCPPNCEDPGNSL